MNNVLRTMQMVIARSRKGSITMTFSPSLILSQAGEHVHIRYFFANSYQHGGHFWWASSSSKRRDEKQSISSTWYQSLQSKLRDLIFYCSTTCQQWSHLCPFLFSWIILVRHTVHGVAEEADRAQSSFPARGRDFLLHVDGQLDICSGLFILTLWLLSIKMNIKTSTLKI